MSFLENCRKFISIDSSTAQGCSGIADFAGQLAIESGLHVEYQTLQVNDCEEKNIIVTLDKGLTDDYFLMQSHLDTTEPGVYALWNKTESNPFNASIYKNKIYGLGVAQAKLDFLCKLEALKQLKQKNIEKNIALVGTYGHNNGMLGAIKFLRKSGAKPKYALIGAPTDLKLINASSGFATIEITVPFSEEELDYHKTHDLMISSSTQSKIFYGKSQASHQSCEGENAIESMLDYLSNLPDGIIIMDMEGGANYNSIPETAVLELDIVGGMNSDTIISKCKKILSGVREVKREFLMYPEIGFEPNISTLNIGKVKKYKDHIKFIGACYMTPTISQKIYEGWIKQLKGICASVGASFTVVEYKQPFLTEKDNFTQICQESLTSFNIDSKLNKLSTSTEASVFSRLGVKCIVFGAGQAYGNINEPNEMVNVNDLNRSIEVYKTIAQRVCA